MSINAQKRDIKAEHFANLVAVAYADGFLDNAEKLFLEERAEEYNIDKDEVKRIMDDVERLKFVVPLNHEEKEEQLADVVYMSMIDGHIHEKEYELCLAIAEKLEFERKELDHVIALTEKLWQG
jgi:tellurite resistance protein